MNDPKLYQKNNYIQKRDALLCLDEYASRIKWKKHSNKILDIGCGDGSVTSILKQYIPSDHKLLGCDISEKMVDYANNHHCNDQTSFTVLDIEGNLPEGIKGNFDHAFSFYALHWIIDQERAFTNIYNLLTEGGDCFLIFMGGAPVYDMYRVLARDNKWSCWMKDLDRFISPYHDLKEPDKVIKKMMEKIGFVDIDVQCKQQGFAYENWDMTRKSIIAVDPFSIPEDLREDFLDDCTRVLKEMQLVDISNNNCSQTISFGYRLLVVYGQKPSTAKILDII